LEVAMIGRTDALTALRNSEGAFGTAPEHAGVILREEYLEPMGITAYQLAKATGMSQTRVGEILRGTRGITADAAVRLAVALETSAEFWLGLQADYELRRFLHAEGRAVVGSVRSLAPAGASDDGAGADGRRRAASAGG
jgi:addiction module HigA family antidote